MNKKTTDVSTRLTPDQFAKRSMDARVTAMNKALEGEKVRYTSTNDMDTFKTFLEGRLDLWSSLKSGSLENTRLKKGWTNRYFERMYDKTKEILA
jgi:hypothetical protein